MRYGIPGFRTPRDVLDAEIQRILDLGVHDARCNCRIGTDVTMEQICAGLRRRVPRHGRPGRAAAAGARRATRRTSSPRPSFLQGLQRRPPAARRQARRRHRRRRHLDRRRHGGAPPRPHRARASRPTARARDRRPRWRTTSPTVSAQAGRRGHADLGVRQSTRCRPTSTRSSRRRPKASPSAAGWRRSRVVKDADGRATALRVAQCEAKIVGGRLEIKMHRRHRGDIPADLIVSAIGQAVDFTGLEEFNNGKGAHRRRQELPGRRASRASSSAATSIAPAPADHRHRPRRASPPTASTASCAARSWTSGRRSTCTRSTCTRKMVEKGAHVRARSHEPHPRHRRAATAAIHNFDNRSDRYVIPHEELFLGHFQLHAAQRAQHHHARRRTARWATSRSA